MGERLKSGTVGVLCALLMGCGGGGGDGGGTGGSQQPAAPNAATANITAADFAGQSDSAARGAKSSLGSLSLFTGNGSVVGAAASRAEAFQTTTQRMAASRLFARRDPNRADTLAVSTQTEPCDSGSLLFTVNEASATTSTVGDTVTVTSQNCVVGGQAVGGSLRLVLNAYSATASSTSGAVGVTFTGFGVPALMLNGSVAAQYTESASGGSVTLSFQGLNATSAAGTLQWFHTVVYTGNASSGTETVVFSGLIGVNGGSVRFDQIAPFVLVGGDPASGTLQITGANGGRVRIVAGSTRFTYEFYAAGNNGSTPDATAPGLVY